MIEKVIKLYQFNELSEKAKEAVKELNFWHIQLHYLINDDKRDLTNSINTIGKYIGIYFENGIQLDSELEGMEGRRFLKYLLNRIDIEKEYTGVYTDYIFFDALESFIKLLKQGEKVNADTYIDLLERCYKNIIDDNIEVYNSNEFMEDFLNNNEYYFYENGGLWLGA